jgi:uncharacterized membrane protein
MSLVTPTGIDSTGYTVTGAVSGSLILVSYNQYLPRIDILALSHIGAIVWIKGTAAEQNAKPPAIPIDMLAIATIYQTWTNDRSVSNNGTRVVPMGDIADLSDRIDTILGMVSRQQLESNIHTREAGAKKGLFVDPFLDDSLRDNGIGQNAAIINGVLMLPINGDATYVNADITAPLVLSNSNSAILKQSAITGSQKINPYLTFSVPPAIVLLTPAIDRHVAVIDNVISNDTVFFIRDSAAANTVARTIINRKKTINANLRPIQVSFAVSGFSANEALSIVAIDGVTVTPTI